MWSAQDWAAVQHLRAAGLTISAVAARIGRRVNTVKSKIAWESMSIEQREARAVRIRFHKETHRETIKTARPLEMVRREERPGSDVLAERELRAAAGPRDLTGAFFGDPPKGYSALERRT